MGIFHRERRSLYATTRRRITRFLVVGVESQPGAPDDSGRPRTSLLRHCRNSNDHSASANTALLKIVFLFIYSVLRATFPN